jgi:hypothetical protein
MPVLDIFLDLFTFPAVIVALISPSAPRFSARHSVTPGAHGSYTGSSFAAGRRVVGAPNPSLAPCSREAFTRASFQTTKQRRPGASRVRPGLLHSSLLRMITTSFADDALRYTYLSATSSPDRESDDRGHPGVAGLELGSCALFYRLRVLHDLVVCGAGALIRSPAARI